MKDEHMAYCSVWETSAGGQQSLNNAKPCSCGFRAREATRRAEALVGVRPLRPLGMSEDDFLRTLGIKPEKL